MVMVHLCRDAAFSGRLSHDTFFYGVGLEVLSCRSRWTFCKMEWQDGNRIKVFRHKHISCPGNKLEDIGRTTDADNAFVEDVARMYLTHQNGCWL